MDWNESNSMYKYFELKEIFSDDEIKTKVSI